MKAFLSKKLVLGATGLILLAGAGAAVAATQLSGGSGRQAYIDDVASHLGVSPSALTSAMKAAAIDRVNAAVAAGRLTKAQSDALKQRIQEGRGPLFFGTRPGRGGLRAGAAAAASYLGISEATLRGDLASGKTLAQIAASTPGKSVSGLKAAILAAEKTRLNEAVSNGRITPQEETQRVAKISSRLDTLINRRFTRGAGFGPRFDRRW